MDFVAVYLPSIFVVKSKRTSDTLLPPPGLVTLEDLQPPPDPLFPFLRARKSVPSPSMRGAGCLADDCDDKAAAVLPVWDVDEIQVMQHAKLFDVAATVAAAFQDSGGGSRAQNEHTTTDADAVIRSLCSPFRERSRGPSNAVVWRISRHPVSIIEPSVARLGGRKLVNRHRAHLQGAPWSIVPFTDGVEVKKNMIYGGDGIAVAQIDFGHGGSSSCGIHAHALVRNNLEHAAVHEQDHLFPLTSVPWFWCAVRHEVVTSGARSGLRLADTSAVDFGCSWVAGRLVSDSWWWPESDDEDDELADDFSETLGSGPAG